MELASLLESCAIEEGFALAGALDLDLAEAAMAPHIARYDRWIGEGRAGAMQYLERGRDRRADPRLAFAQARSVLCVALPYPKRPGGARSALEGPRYARYIRGRDYHDEIAWRLERVMAAAAQRSGLGDALKWKVCVDTSAVLERSWAALAGLGWLGKNTLLINPKLGSYLFLGEVLINQPTGQGPRPLPDYCGHCTRCLEACPTQAITEPRWLDSRRCISYWTLEKRGALELSESDKRAIGPWIAGCDICQEVCPFNQKPVKKELGKEPGREELAAAPVASADNLSAWEALLREELPEYRQRVSDSSLSRVKPAQFSRNLAISLANAVREHREALTTLKPRVEQRLAAEADEAARVEWERCLRAFGQ